jgi:hypothetical protein
MSGWGNIEIQNRKSEIRKGKNTMNIDFTGAEALKDKITEHSRSSNLALYSEAQERSLSVSELLEDIDPSPRNPDGSLATPLDAFERQLYLANVVVTGRQAVTLEQFMTGAGMILLPEYITREIARGYQMVQDPSQIVAAQVPERGPSVKPIYIQTTEAKKSLSRRHEAAQYPVVKLLSWPNSESSSGGLEHNSPTMKSAKSTTSSSTATARRPARRMFSTALPARGRTVILFICR